MQRTKSILEKHVQTILLSLITAATIGAFTFLWELNATVASLKTTSDDRDRTIDNVQQGINSVRLNLQEVKEKVIRLEAQNIQYQNNQK